MMALVLVQHSFISDYRYPTRYPLDGRTLAVAGTEISNAQVEKIELVALGRLGLLDSGPALGPRG